MPLFLAEHTWAKDKTLEVMQAAQPLFTGENLPTNVKLHATYLYVEKQKAVCVWESDNIDTLVEIFDAMKDVLPCKNTFSPITQIYPSQAIR